MSLKGYQWFDTNNKVLMTYWFKDCSLYINEDTPLEEIYKFKEWLNEKNCEILNTKYKTKGDK